MIRMAAFQSKFRTTKKKCRELAGRAFLFWFRFLAQPRGFRRRRRCGDRTEPQTCIRQSARDFGVLIPAPAIPDGPHPMLLNISKTPKTDARNCACGGRLDTIVLFPTYWRVCYARDPRVRLRKRRCTGECCFSRQFQTCPGH